MGSNDMAGPALAARLAEIRAQFCFNRVIWLLPCALTSLHRQLRRCSLW
jgi:hypothetical protein